MQKRKNFSWLVVILFFVFLFILVNHAPKNFDPIDIKYVRIAETKVAVELALDQATQAQGLSGRAALAEGEGMLFVFDRPDKHYFWMKDMNFPIDIIWLAPSEGEDGDAKVIYIKENARPELYPENYGPDQNSKYVLEVNAGFVKEHDIKMGDKARFAF